jgi:hypothetical protein
MVEEFNLMTRIEEEKLAEQYSKRYLWQAELNGLLTPLITWA